MTDSISFYFIDFFFKIIYIVLFSQYRRAKDKGIKEIEKLDGFLTFSENVISICDIRFARIRIILCKSIKMFVFVRFYKVVNNYN